MEYPELNNKSQLIQPQNTSRQFFKSALDYAVKVYDSVTTPQNPREEAESTEEMSPSSPTPIPGAYPRDSYISIPASELSARTTQNLAKVNVTNDNAGTDAAVQPLHHYDNSVPHAAETRDIPHNYGPDIKNPSDQETTRTSTQGLTSQLHGAHHFTIGGSPRFENIGVKNEYNCDNHDGVYGMEVLKEFVSFKALHDSYAQDPTRRVHPGTRQYVLKRIRSWIDIPSAKEPIFWLRGPAGVGKSAIAQTIARSCSREKLAATFFFYRSDPGRNDGNRLFITLAWQIAFAIPATKNALIRSINERPDIPMKDVETQFEELIVRPFLALQESGVQLSAPVVIIDGVDECSDDNLQQRFLKIIGNAIRDSRIPLRFLICSRPEAHIQDAINIFLPLIVQLDLAEVDDANQDIEKYLKTEFARIALEQDLDPAWPGEKIIQEFVAKASGQFVYASTVIKWVGDQYSSAETQLDIIRGLKPPSTISPFAELDQLYMEILRRQRDPAFLKDFLSLLIGRDGIDVDGLYNDDPSLMNVSKKELHRKLRGMYSLLKLEPYIDIHHRSFLDFLQDPSRSDKYYISKEAGTRRYLDFISGSLVRYALTVIEGHDNHKLHFSPRFHDIVRTYPGEIVLPAEEWWEALRPLLDFWNKLLSLPNFRSTWELLPCKECTGFHTMRNLLLHLAFRLGVSEPDFNSALMAEFQSDGSEGMHNNAAPSTRSEIGVNTRERDLDDCLSPLLQRLRARKLGTLLDTDMIQLACSILHFDHTETAMRLRSILDAQNLVDLIDELINHKYNSGDYGLDISHKAAHLALEIYARVPALPRSLFSKEPVGLRVYIATSFSETELLFQTGFLYRMLDPNYIARVTGSDTDDGNFYFVLETNENKKPLSEWRKWVKPSSDNRIRIMLEVAKAIRYFHSMGILLHDSVNSKHICLDSEFHVIFQRFLGLNARYVKVTPLFDLDQKWLSYEVNVFLFGCLLYEMCFGVEISHNERIYSKRDTIEQRPSEPEIRDDEWQLIQKCCATDPKNRPSMDDIVREMEVWKIT